MSVVRKGLDRIRSDMAEDYRRAGKLPDTAKIEKTIQQDVRGAEIATRNSPDHPLHKSRGGER